MRVFLSGPYTSDPERCVTEALEAGARLLDAGFAVLVPHLLHFFDARHPHPYEAWMRNCLAWVEGAQALVRIGGDSPGADREVAHARARGIPVFFGVDALLEVADEEARRAAAGL